MGRPQLDMAPLPPLLGPPNAAARMAPLLLHNHNPLAPLAARIADMLAREDGRPEVGRGDVERALKRRRQQELGGRTRRRDVHAEPRVDGGLAHPQPRRRVGRG